MKVITPAALVLGLLAGGCNNTQPTAPTPPSFTETFSGTLAAQGTDTYAFNVQQTGGVTITLTSITPSITVGLGIGTPSGSTCALISAANATASATPQLAGTAAVGTFCLAIYDLGNVVDSATYSITVVHP